ncbi:hypothetical protein TeGR_g9556, partial [Tetraparma gracilis]
PPPPDTPPTAPPAPTVNEEFEVTLKRPLGLTLSPCATSLGVVVSSVAPGEAGAEAGVQPGDRILEVSSTFNNFMWPHATVDGIVAAVNGRPKSFPVTFRLSRALPVGTFDPLLPIPPTATAAPLPPISATLLSTFSLLRSSAAFVPGAATHLLLLSRSTELLQRYTLAHVAGAAEPAMPPRVAGRVLETLGGAGAQLDGPTLAAVMSAYLCCRDSAGARRAFEAATGLHSLGMSAPPPANPYQLPANPYALTKATASELLCALSMSNDFTPALRVLRNCLSWSPNGGIKPDAAMWNMALSAARNNPSCYPAAKDLFEAMPPSMRSSVSFNIMVLLSSSSRENMPDALEYMRQMPAPDSITYTTLMKAHLSHRPPDIPAAMSLLSQMKASPSLTPDVTSFNTLIKGLCDAGQEDAALSVLDLDMVESGVLGNGFTLSYLMRGFVKAKRYVEALSLFEKWRAGSYSSTTDNVVLYSMAVDIAARNRDYDKALSLVTSMKQNGLEPNVKTLTSLMKACTSGGRPDIGVEVYRGLGKGGMKGEVDARAREAGLAAMVQGELWEEAVEEVMKWGSSGSVKGKEVISYYQLLLPALLSSNQIPTATSLFSHFLKTTDLIPSQQLLWEITGSLKTSSSTSPNPAFFFLFHLLDALSSRKIPIPGSTYAFILHRCADHDSHSSSTLGKALIAARRQGDVVVGLPRDPAEKHQSWVELAEESRPNPSLPTPLVVRVNPDTEGVRVQVAERRLLSTLNWNRRPLAYKN